MRLLGKFAVGALGLAAVLALTPATASASVLTITDTYGGTNTVWTFDTDTMTLSAEFQDPDGLGTGVSNAYTGTYIDSVQWKIDGADPSTASVDTTTAGLASDWTTAVDASLNANQCGGGANSAVCSQTTSPLGFGPIANGSTLTWVYSATFASGLPAVLTEGNIRAAFNNADGSNFNIFSPDGGTFTNGGGGSTGGGGQTIPEPASLALFGLAALGLGRRSRRNRK